MKRQFRFNRKSIEALPPCPADSLSKEIEYSDQEVGGLRLQVNRLGRKAFLFRYTIDGRKRAVKVGGYPETGIDEARAKVIEWRALLARGIDPRSERSDTGKPGLTFERFFNEHLWPHVQATKRSAKDDESRFRNHILPAFGSREMAKISPAEWQKFHNGNKSKVQPATANRIIEVARRSYVLAVTWALLPESANTAKGIKLHPENNRRERYLSRDELRRFLEALKHESNRAAADVFEFLLATGARREEAIQARWEHVDLERRRWYLPHTKNGRSRFVVLNDAAMDILHRRPRLAGNPFVFFGKETGRPLNNPSKAWKRVLEAAGIDPRTTRIHDLRHTHASYFVGVASLHEIAGILGHRNTATTQRYAHLNDERLREASGHVAALMAAAQRPPAP